MRGQTRHLGAEVGHALQQLAVVQLHDRGVGRAGRGLGDEVGAQGAQPGELDLECRETVEHHGVVERTALDQSAETTVAESLGQFEHRHAAFGAQGSLRDLPPGVLPADQTIGRDDHVIEEDLTEVRLPRRLTDGPDLDAG